MTPHRPPPPTEHAGNWPTLRICPHCGADLSDRPPIRGREHCPNCTIEYDSHTWSAACWSTVSAMRRPMWPIGFPLLIAFALAVVSAWFVLPAVVLLAVFLTRVLRFDPKRPPNAAIIAWPGGLSIRVRRSRRMVTIPWEECDDVIVREAPDDDATDFVAAILWPVIFVLDILSPRPDLSHSREIAIKRRPTGAGPAFAEVVVVGDRPFMLAQLIRDTATARTSSAAIVHAQ